MVANTQPPDSAETWQRLVERIEQAEEGLRERDQALLAQQAALTRTVERLEHEIVRLEGKIADLTPQDQEPERRMPLSHDRSDVALIVLFGALVAIALGSVPLLGSPIVLYTIGMIAVIIPGVFVFQLLDRRRRQAPALSPAARGVFEAVDHELDTLLRERIGR